MKYPDLTAGQGEAIINMIGGWERFKKVLSGELILVVKVVELLKLITTVKVSGAAKFVARDAFGPKNPDGIKFYLWDNFKNNFLDKTEKNVPAKELNIHTLIKASVDKPIRDELTSAKEETSLVYMYELIKLQKNGETGLLLTNGYANIFYIRDAKDNLWAVLAFWYSGNREWDVSADSVEGPVGWDAGYHVFSCK